MENPEPPKPVAIVMFRRCDTDHIELFASEGAAIERYEQVEADNVRIWLASNASIRWHPDSAQLPPVSPTVDTHTP